MSRPGRIISVIGCSLYVGTGDPHIAIESQLLGKAQKCFP
jgi:hypothetical protein